MAALPLDGSSLSDNASRFRLLPAGWPGNPSSLSHYCKTAFSGRLHDSAAVATPNFSREVIMTRKNSKSTHEIGFRRLRRGSNQ